MNRCINCGKEASELHHVVPLALGGNDIDSNKVWLCIDCHNKIHKRGIGMGQLAAQSPKFKNAHTNTFNYHSLTERNKFIKIPPIKNQFLKNAFIYKYPNNKN